LQLIFLVNNAHHCLLQTRGSIGCAPTAEAVVVFRCARSHIRDVRCQEMPHNNITSEKNTVMPVYRGI